jgi:hypothetical protein
LKKDYLYIKAEEFYIIWFEKSNQWVKMDEPQWFIFLLYNKGISRTEAQQRFQREWSQDDDQSMLMVNNLYDSLLILKEQGFTEDVASEGNFIMPPCSRGSLKKHFYRAGGKAFCIGYDSGYARDYIHSPLKYLEVDASDAIVELREYHVMSQVEGFYLKGNDSIQFVEELPQLKQLLFVELSRYLHDNVDGWMTIMHASALKSDGKLLVFTSASGSGKSTMAARLLTQGYEFFSDDFIPVGFDEKAYPFPPAVCLKKNSVHLLGKENIAPDYFSGETGYMVPGAFDKISPSDVKAILFIRFDANGPDQLQKISLHEAFTEFMKESWVCNTMEEVRKFMKWFGNMKFFRLVYNDGIKGAEAVRNLVNDDFNIV